MNQLIRCRSSIWNSRPSKSTDRKTVRLISRFNHSTSGATAVEFAIVGLPFFALLMAIFEVGIVFFAQQALQTATVQAARYVMTGQAQAQNMTPAQFKQLVCNDASSLFNCANLFVNVQNFTSFSSVSLSNPVQNGTFNTSGMSYNIGGAGSVEVVQVFYKWPVYTGPLGFNLSSMNGNIHLLVGTSAFRNEP
jgi:Flp pilus assembly protein TadG